MNGARYDSRRLCAGNPTGRARTGPPEIRVPVDADVTLLLRPVRPTDREALEKLFEEFEQERGYWRSFATNAYFSRENVPKCCMIDYELRMTLIASYLVGKVEKLVGCAVYALDPQSRFAECALFVAQPYRRCGVGMRLLRRLIEIAEPRGIRGLCAVVSPGDDARMKLFQKCSRRIDSVRRGTSIFLRIPFEGTPTASGKARDRSTPR